MDLSKLPLHNPLTTKEEKLAQCLVDGLSVREIAEQLDTCTATVKNLTNRIHTKCGTSSRAELLSYLFFHGTRAMDMDTRKKLVLEAYEDAASFIAKILGHSQQSTIIANRLRAHSALKIDKIA